MTYIVKILPPMVEEIEDGLYAVTASDKDGRHYTHFRHFDAKALGSDQAAYVRACLLRAKVAAAGEINAEHWDCYIPYGSDAWDIEGMEVTLMDDFERRQKEGMFF